MKRNSLFFIGMFSAFVLSACADKAISEPVNEPEVVTIDIAGTEDATLSNDEEVPVSSNDLESEEISSDSIPVTENSYISNADIVIEDIADYSSSGVIYSSFSPEQCNKQVECQVVFGDISIVTDGGQKAYNIDIKLVMNEEYSQDNIDYNSCMTPAIEFADGKTGGMLETVDQINGNGYSNEIIFTRADEEYCIEYGCQQKITVGDYSEKGNDYIRPVTFDLNYTVKTPADYDSLLLKITPVTSFREAVTEGLNNNRQLEDDWAPGTKVFKITN